MGQIYSVTWDAKAITTAVDLYEVTVAADRPILIHQLDILQTTDLGDAAEEVLRIGVYRGATAGTSGTAMTEVTYADNNAQTATASIIEYTTAGTSSTVGTLIHVLGWNVRIPTQFIWTPETRIRVDSTEDPLSFRLIAAPADSITCSSTLIWEEL